MPERAAPSARVWQPVFGSSDCLEQIESLRRGAWWVAGGQARWARILTITGGSSMAALRRVSGQAMIFKLLMGPALAVAVRLSQFVFSFRHR